MSGAILLRGDYPARLRIDFPHFDLDPLLRIYLKGGLTGHSLAAGTVEISGPLKHWRQMALTGTLTQFSASVEKIALTSQGPVRFRLANGVFSLDQFHIAGSETDLTATGAFGLAQNSALNLRADGTLDLHLLHTLNPNISGSGRLALAIRAGGTRAHPDLQGQVQVSDGNFAYSDLPNGLADVNGTLVFTADRLQVQTLAGRSGGGNVALTGFLAWQRGLYFDLSAHIHDMRLRYPQGISSMANADLRLSGTPQNSLLSGDLVLTRFGVNPDFDFALYLARLKLPAAITAGDSPITWSKVTGPPELHVDASTGTVTLSAAAPAGGAVVSLSSSAAVATVLPA